MTDNILQVGNDDWDKEVLKADPDKLVMVIFWTIWCEPCMELLKTIEKLADKYMENIKFVSLNIDDNINIGGIYKVSIVPTLMFLRGGEKLKEMITNVPEEKVEEEIHGLLK